MRLAVTQIPQKGHQLERVGKDNQDKVKQYNKNNDRKLVDGECTRTNQ